MGWNYDKKIESLPPGIKNLFKNYAKILLADLLANRLEVALVGAPDPRHVDHKIRMVVSRNPQWYRELYHGYRSEFRRDLSVRALERISEEKDRDFRISPFKYDSIYRELIMNMLIEGYEDERGFEIPPQKEAQDYFRYDQSDSNPVIESSFCDDNLPL